jgi:aryl-alcohol dehydrogenase-like predicted oxidoreductase
VTLAQIRLAYVLKQTFPVIALIGSTKVSNLESALGALNVELKLEEMNFLDLNIQEGREI